MFGASSPSAASNTMAREQTSASEHAQRPGWLRGIWLRCRRILECRKQRRALLDLDDHMLADIGVTREQAMREANKPW